MCIEYIRVFWLDSALISGCLCRYNTLYVQNFPVKGSAAALAASFANFGRLTAAASKFHEY